ncbi:metallophosphoesterase [Nakamurella sp. YIM 132087]|uniref:Metallophosphoesterase n=1 Tax=Nakamurella alba TaxID=2665158 RepID=A0A7K1FNH3_9ACTN|nr:metallophosphoesterase [Nakamurella alba]MTD14859.1 metallophosphoesterase [Nakamurella alba]
MSVPFWVFMSSAMFAGAGVYLWWRLIARTTTRFSTPWWIGTVLAALVVLSAPVALFGQFAMPMGFQRVVGWPAWLGYSFIIFTGCLALVAELVRLGRWLVDRRRAAARGEKVTRRVLFERVLAGAIVAGGAVLTGVSLAGALGTPRVLRRSIAIRNLPAEAAGMRIVLISDLHVGSLTRHDDTRRIVDIVNAQNPDIVCLAGDFSDGDAATLAADLAPLADLRPTVGTFFVTGNHEFYFDVASWMQWFPTIGVRVLANESVQVRGVLLAGTHDIQGESQGLGPDVPAALAGRAAGQPAILLSHNPVVLDDAIAQDVDLLLAGHTHGGQFYPGVWIVGATTRTLSGYYAFGDTQVFVTNGCRFWGPPARIGAPMDITVLELTPA